MATNTVYTFVRQPSDEPPPRFDELLSRLESIGIYSVILNHPDSDWNRISIATESRAINLRKIEDIFKKSGYSFIGSSK